VNLAPVPVTLVISNLLISGHTDDIDRLWDYATDLPSGDKTLIHDSKNFSGKKLNLNVSINISENKIQQFNVKTS